MKQFDIIVVGGGLSGLPLSLLLGQAGFKVACVDGEPIEKQLAASFDERTTAISYGSRNLLCAAGIWQRIEQAGFEAEPITRIEIRDGGWGGALHFDAAEVDADAFGWIVNNADLRRVMASAVADHKSITHLTGVKATGYQTNDTQAELTLDDGTVLAARLVVGADGRKSFLRGAAGIGSWSKDYGHDAIVCVLHHEKPHNGLALEHFMPQGPFAMLPMRDGADGRHRSALVWSVSTGEGVKWTGCDQHVFEAAVNARAGKHYGRITVSGKRGFWPLNLVRAYALTAPRTALIAEAAHGIHPIAGQGLNLSLRDVAALAEILADAKKTGEDIGGEAVLARYVRMRGSDNTTMTAATDVLTHLFSNDMRSMAMARRAGLALVAKLPPVKRFFMRQAMGTLGNLPRLIKNGGKA